MLPYVMIDGAPVSTYFLMGLSGYLAAIILVLMKRRAFDLRKRDVMRIAIYAAIGVVIGARLFSSIGQIFLHGREPDFWTAENWGNILSGFGVFYGGLLGSIGILALLAKLRRIDMKNMFNAYTYAALAFLIFGRLGCYSVGCCYGIMLANGTRFPVQLFEAEFCLIVLIVFLIIKPERRWPDVPLFLIYVIIYSVGRFVLEFFRGDASRGVWLLSTSQLIALALIAVAVIWLRKNKFVYQKARDAVACGGTPPSGS